MSTEINQEATTLLTEMAEVLTPFFQKLQSVHEADDDYDKEFSFDMLDN